MRDLVLPAFELDCRDWLVVTPSDAGLPDEVAGSPLLAVLSTAVIGADAMRSANAVLTVALFDDDVALRPIGPGCVARQLADDLISDSPRYVLPAPDSSLALVAEFTAPDGMDGEVRRRIEALMRSFRWAD